MSIRFLLDEHLRGLLWRAVQHHNGRGGPVLDAVRVGDADAPPLSTPDPVLIRWAQTEQRILVSNDRRTMIREFLAHRGRGDHSPGLFVLVPNAPLSEVLEFLVAAAHASEPSEWIDRIQFIP
jgi:hypothetical protein